MTEQRKNDNPHKKHRERMRQRIAREGILGFQPHEVLEVLLYPVVPLKDTNEMGHALLKEFGTIENVFDAPLPELLKIKGMTNVAAQYIGFLSLLPEYLQMHKPTDIAYLKTPQQCYDFLRPLFYGATGEKCYMVSLDINFKVIMTDLVSSGSAAVTFVDNAKVIEIAKRRGAAHIVIAHNHPAGLLSPSPEDIVTTRRLTLALAACDLHLVDHFILTAKGYFSFANNLRDDQDRGFFESVYSSCLPELSSKFIKEEPVLRHLVMSVDEGFAGFKAFREVKVENNED